MSRKRVTIVANPAAGRLKSRKHLERFASLLHERGCEADIRWTRSSGIGSEAVDLEGSGQIIVAAGGDGTLHQVANALRRSGDMKPVAFLPLGTANVFCFEMKLQRKHSDLADLVAATTARDYPTGWGRFVGLDGVIEERVFLLMAGIGWDARVAMTVNQRFKKIHGKGAYILAGMGLILAGRRSMVRLSADHMKMDGEAVIIANSPYYGGNFILAPWARPERPGLAVSVVKQISIPGLIRLVWCARRHKPDQTGAVIYQEAHRIEILTPGIPIQMDGDAVGFTPAVFMKKGWSLPVIYGKP